MPQRQSPRGPHSLKTSSSDSDPLHHRPITDRSPKLRDRRSPRNPQPDPVNQKKLGIRIADLGSQLGQAQKELKILKEQLASAEAARKEAQRELEMKTMKPATPEPEENKKADSSATVENADEQLQGTDVFEVSIEKTSVEPKAEPGCLNDQVEKENNPIEISSEPLVISEPEKPSFHDLALKDEEINMLKAKLEEKEEALVVLSKENENLKNQLNEANSSISSAKVKADEMSFRLTEVEKELQASKANAACLKEKLESMEGAEQALEAEMKKMRVQTEQWRKAADAAAAVLAGSVQINGGISARCGSMDKHFGGVFKPATGGYTGFVGSPGMADDYDDSFGSGKRKGSGIKLFGDLWKNKGQK